MEHDNINKIEFVNVTKKFGKLVANDSINFSVKENEIHALLGENGAGKSTLMSILFGLYKPTSGSIKINGNEVRIKDPREANKLKIAMLPQHFKLVDNMSVLENVMLGYELTNIGFLDKKAAKKKIEDTQKKYKINLKLNVKVGSLPVSDKQKVELLKILWGEADIMIFDEPTSILTPEEVSQFLKLILDLKKAGKTILLITHKLPEIKAVSDSVSIIRKGKYIKTVLTKTVSEKQLANLMVGRVVDLNLSTLSKEPINSEVEVLKINELNYKADGFGKSLKNISLNIKSGEILGIAAIDGNGQSELIKIIGGLEKPTSGTIMINDHETSNKKAKHLYYSKNKYSNKDIILRVKKLVEKFSNGKSTKEISKKPFNVQLFESLKIAERQTKELARKQQSKYNEGDFYWSKTTSLLSHIPEDRHAHGLILDYSVTKNAVLQDLKYFSKFGILNNKTMKLRLDYIKEKYDVRGIQNYSIKTRALSGGNQQKLILGREIERGSNVLLAVHPTRGLDVGAIRNIYTNIIKSRNQGTAVLLSSGELDEIMQISDRIIVIYEGKIVSESKYGELSKLELGSLMSTGKGIKISNKTINLKEIINKKIVKKAAPKKVVKDLLKQNIKYISKNKIGLWTIKNSKSGKNLRVTKTRKEAIALSGTFKNVTKIMIEDSNGWRTANKKEAETANVTKLSANDKKIKGGK